jgi:arylformamidase
VRNVTSRSRFGKTHGERQQEQSMSQTTASLHAQIAELGAQFNPDILAITRSLYAGLVAPPSAEVRTEYDIAYGPDARQKLDVYDAEASTLRPVLFYVPGGGFTGGDKRMDETFYGNLARWFVARGFVVVTMNYRLAPDNVWPSGAEDVGLALAWTAANIRRHGGDPGRIFVFGQSAGATHVATFLFHPRVHRPVAGIAGAVLASGLYRMTEAHRAPNLIAYFGSDPSRYADRSPITHIAGSKLPLLLTVAEFDPGFLAAPTYQLAEAVTRRDGKPPQVVWLKGHNHVSTVFSFGTGDDAFGRKILEFTDGV